MSSTLRQAISHATLGWIKPDLDEILRQAGVALEQYVEQPGAEPAIEACVALLHQAHGTLSMLELAAPTMVAEEMEQLAVALRDGKVAQAEEASATLMRGTVLLPDYLERLQDGHRDIPIVLLPLLNDLRAARGAPLLGEQALLQADGAEHSAEELDQARSSLSGRNRALMQSVGGAVKEELLQVKEQMDLFLRGARNDPDQLQAQVDTLGNVADTLQMLGMGAASQAVLEQKQALALVASGQQPVDEDRLLDIAGALLSVDAVIDEQSFNLGASGEEDAAELGRNAELREVAGVLLGEALEDLAESRRLFEAFIETGWDHSQLAEVPRLLHEVAGAMRMLEMPGPADCLDALGQYTGRELQVRRQVPDARQLDLLADALSSLEYYIEAVREHRSQREDILEIARTSLAALDAGGSVEAAMPGFIDPELVQALPTGQALTPMVPAAEAAPTPQAADAHAGQLQQAAGVPAPAAAMPAAPGDGFHARSEDIDDEIREVFLEEFAEEIDNLGQLLPAWRAEPDNLELLRPIRRVFHTLKGSGRLVGAATLGEFSWAVENALNRVLDGTRPANAAVIELVERAQAALPQLHRALQGQGAVEVDLAALEARAERIALGQDMALPEIPPLAPPPVIDVAEAAEADAVGIEAAASDAAGIEAAPAGESVHAGSAGIAGLELAPLEDASTQAGVPGDGVEALSRVEAEPAVEAPPEDIGPVPEAGLELPEPGASLSLAPLEEEQAPAAPVAGEAEAPDEALSEALDEGIPAAVDDAGAASLQLEPIEAGEDAAPAEAGERQGSPAAVDAVLLEILDAEVTAHLATLDMWLANVVANGLRADDKLLRAMHTINGAFAMTEVPEITEVTLPAEGYVKRLLASGLAAGDAGFKAIGDTAWAIRQALEGLKQDPQWIPSFTSLAATLVQLRDALPAPQPPVLPLEPEVQAPAPVVREQVEAVPPQDVPEAQEEQREEPGEPVEAVQLPEVAALDEAGSGDAITAEGFAEAGEASTNGDDGAGLRIEAQQVREPEPAPEAPVVTGEGLAPPSQPVTFIEISHSYSAEFHVPAPEPEVPVTPETLVDTGMLESLPGLTLPGGNRDGRESREGRQARWAEASLEDAMAVAGPAGFAPPAEAIPVGEDAATDAGDEAEAAIGAEAGVLAADTGSASLGTMLPAEAAGVEAGDEPAGQVLADMPSHADAEVHAGAAQVSDLQATGLHAGPDDSVALQAPGLQSVAPAAAVASVLPAAAEDPDQPLQLDELDAELVDVFLEEGTDLLDQADGLLTHLDGTDGDRERIAGLQRHLHTLKGGARMAGLFGVGDLSHALESVLEAASEQGGLRTGDRQLLQRGFDRLHSMLTRVAARRAIGVPQALIDELDARARDASPYVAGIAEPPSVDTPVAVEEVTVVDQAATDAGEAAADAQPAGEPDEAPAAVEAGQEATEASVADASPASPGTESVTEAASAKAAFAGEVAAGEVAVGELPADEAVIDEARVEDAVAEEIGDEEAVAEEIVTEEAVFEEVAVEETVATGAPMGEPAAPDAAPAGFVPQLVAESFPPVAPAPARTQKQLRPLSPPMEVAGAVGEEEDPAQPLVQDQVRVRADLLDRLVNNAGEVAIYRAHLEQQLGAFRAAMAEMDQTNARLRDQLRRLDIETEAQIVARYQREQDQGDTSFDPLELDRFSTLQQLSRALAESAADLTSLQGVLDDLARQYEALLHQQSRVSTELQDGLMRTRMLPFETIAPRLRRVVRQAAADSGKDVEFVMEGAHGELDRSVLQRMVAPLEHMLRNAVAHGLESSWARANANKPTKGRITLVLAREGSELVLQVSDDGAGLDLEAIRTRAIERGLLDASANPGQAEIEALIFETGFSTAGTVSHLAGRGVGLDVVRNEVRQLGGTIDINSERGKGTTFTLRLPQTLAVARAVLVQAGDAKFAVPVATLQGVGRIDRKRLEAGDGASYRYAGEDYPLYDLCDLVGQAASRGDAATLDEQMPLLLVNVGSLRAAIAVDQWLSSREIVVKPVGPQIASVPGIHGATVLRDGRIAMILDLVPLVRRHVSQPRTEQPVAVVEERHVPLVMVVDDSLTMRKVTGRVLERHNFEVMVARDGVEALEKLAERVPDLLLLDIEMPRMDGYELATRMKADERLRHVPIVMITSRTGEKHRQRAFDIGVERYMGKPYQEHDLMRNVYDMLGLGRARG